MSEKNMKQIAPLTRRQREIYEYLADFIQSRGFAPSLEEIGAAMGLSSLATVHKHLQNLSDRGYIQRGWNRARSLVLLVAKDCCPMCGRALEKSLDEAKVSIDAERKCDTVGSVVDASTSATPTTTEVP